MDGLTYNSASIGTVSVKWPANKEAEIKVLVDQKNATISLLVSGKLLKTWKDPNGFAGRGGALGFNPQLADRMRISEIRLRQWNGQLPNGRDPQAAGGTEDHVHFSNGNNLKGKVGSMAEGKLMVKTSFAEVPCRLRRWLQLCLRRRRFSRMKKSWRGSRLAERVESLARFWSGTRKVCSFALPYSVKSRWTPRWLVRFSFAEVFGRALCQHLQPTGGLGQGFSAGGNLSQASALFKITFEMGCIINSSSESQTTTIVLTCQLGQFTYAFAHDGLAIHAAFAGDYDIGFGQFLC